MKTQIHFYCPYCASPYEFDRSALGKEFSCTNQKCMMPYRFEFFDTVRDAEERCNELFGSMDCWSKPFIFPARNREGNVSKWVVASNEGNIRRYEPTKLSDLVDIYVLRALQAGFADMLGCPVTIIDLDKDENYARIEPLELDPSIVKKLRWPAYQEARMRHYCELCLEARASLPGRYGEKLCRQFDLNVVKRILSGEHDTSKPYPCHAGLYDYAYPITVGERILGVLFSGQKRLDSEEGKTEVKRRLSDFAKNVGIPPRIASRYVERMPLTSPEDMQKFVEKVRDLARHVESVARRNYANLRTASDQLFCQEITGRFRKFTKDMKPGDSVFPVLLKLCRNRIVQYVGAGDMALLVSHQQDSFEFARVSENGGESGQVVKIAPDLFSKGPIDRDGFIPLTFGDERELLTSAIKQLVTESASLLFLLRIIPTSGPQVILVFHGDEMAMPREYRPTRINHFARRFYDTLARVIQSELDQFRDRIASLLTLRERERTLSLLAHRLWQPLRGIIFALDYSQRRLTDDDPCHESISRAFDIARRLWTTSSTILSTLTIEEIGEEFFSKRFQVRSVGPILKDAIKIFREEAERKRVRIPAPTRKDDKPYPDIEMNYFAFSTAIQNIIYNAVKYSFMPPYWKKEPYEIEIACWHGSDVKGRPGYFISVQNWGVGIDMATEKDLIFGKHKRGKYAEDRFRTGSGLGLAQARHAIEVLHKGKIDVSSEKKGEEIHKTTFTIYVPLKQEEQK